MKINHFLTDVTILHEVGKRFERARLDRNMSQAQLAEAAGVSPKTIDRIEGGSASTLENFMRVLRALNLLDGMDLLLPEASPGPIELADTRGKGRRRASRVTAGASKRPPAAWAWGDKR